MSDDVAQAAFAVESLDPLLVSTRELLDKYWPYAEPLLRQCVDGAMHGELRTEHIRQGVLGGTTYLFIFKSDAAIVPHVHMAIAMTYSGYPSLPALTIVAMGGTDLRAVHERFWTALTGWAYMLGVRAIDALVSPAMERVLHRFGFYTVYRQVRFDLKEPPK